MSRQAPFLKSVLNEANAHKRQQRLRYANIDQINAVSELVLNTLRGVVPQGKFTLKYINNILTMRKNSFVSSRFEQWRKRFCN